MWLIHSPFAFCFTHLVVNNMKSAYDLLDKRGEIYSSRPRNIMGYVTIFPSIHVFSKSAE